MKNRRELTHDLIGAAARLGALARLLQHADETGQLDWPQADRDCQQALVAYADLWHELRAQMPEEACHESGQ